MGVCGRVWDAHDLTMISGLPHWRLRPDDYEAFQDEDTGFVGLIQCEDAVIEQAKAMRLVTYEVCRPDLSRYPEGGAGQWSHEKQVGGMIRYAGMNINDPPL